VGKRLSDLTTRKVIILVLIMICASPIFAVTTYKTENTYFDYGPILLKKHLPSNVNSVEFQLLWNNYINQQANFIAPVLAIYSKDLAGNTISW